jgi:sugar phosphate isomerase/epimerase
MPPTILFATVLMERNRWTADKQPTVAVSDWLADLARAGFDGIELWQNHAVAASEQERDALSTSPVPITIFNSYVAFTDVDAEGRTRVADLVRRFNCRAVKFNLSSRLETRAQEVVEARRWFASMPDVTPLCECHPGTSVEHSAAAAAAFADWPELRVIVHPFFFSAETLQGWFDAFGPRISHCHVQIRQPGSNGIFTRLDEQIEPVTDQTRRVLRNGFTGSWAIEFTKGVCTPDDSPAPLVAAAIQDLHTLRNLLRLLQNPSGVFAREKSEFRRQESE